MICITIQRTLSVAKVRYLIGDKECFKIFYPRFFTWINLFLLNHVLLYSLLFPFQSIQTYVVRVPVFWMFCLVCIFSSFRVFCIKASRRRWKTVLVLRLTFSDYGTARKKPWQYALKFFKTIQPRSFHFLAMLTTADFYSHNSQFHFYRTIQTTWNSGTPPFHVSVVRHEEKCFFLSVAG